MIHVKVHILLKPTQSAVDVLDVYGHQSSVTQMSFCCYRNEAKVHCLRNKVCCTLLNEANGYKGNALEM